MRHTIDMVTEFHQKFEHPVADNPRMLPDKLAELRINLIASELCEYAAAMGFTLLVVGATHHSDCTLAEQGITIARDPKAHTSIVEAADALGDLDYVVQGANVVHGFPGPAIAEEIHRSNMSKLGADGLPVKRADGKILKGPNYSAPDIALVLSQRTDWPLTNIDSGPALLVAHKEEFKAEWPSPKSADMSAHSDAQISENFGNGDEKAFF